MSEEYPGLLVSVEESQMRVVVDHPPMNVLDAALRSGLDALSRSLVSDTTIATVVVSSADPDFFIAHADVQKVRGRTVEPRRRAGTLGPFHAMVERWRTLPQVSIGVVSGAARGGGLEFLLSLDLVYASRERAYFGLPEVALGILPAGGGTQRLARATTRGRALEIVLGCDDYTADEAAAFGIVTRALPDAQLGDFVDRMAARVSAWPAHAVQLAKGAVDAAYPSPTDGLLEEYHHFNLLLADPLTHQRLSRFLERGGQTRDGERALGSRLPEMLD